jgi:hypothetical protein
MVMSKIPDTEFRIYYDNKCDVCPYRDGCELCSDAQENRDATGDHLVNSWGFLYLCRLNDTNIHKSNTGPIVVRVRYITSPTSENYALEESGRRIIDLLELIGMGKLTNVIFNGNRFYVLVNGSVRNIREMLYDNDEVVICRGGGEPEGIWYRPNVRERIMV